MEFYARKTGIIYKNTPRHIILIDDEDYTRVRKHKWHVTDQGYAATNIEKHKVKLHRFVMNAAQEEEVDHWNNKRLDCRKSNLRIVTRAQNQANRSHAGGSSKYKGVYFEKRMSKRPWVASLMVQGVKYSCGYHETEEEAARAYDARALILSGAFARLNVHVFPELSILPAPEEI